MSLKRLTFGIFMALMISFLPISHPPTIMLAQANASHQRNVINDLIKAISQAHASEVPSPPPNAKLITFRLSGEIDDDLSERFVKTFDKINQSNVQVVVLEIDSPGGSVSSGFEIAKAIEDSKATVYCVVDDTAASMAYYILQSCDVRLMTKRSTLMAHNAYLVGQFVITPGIPSQNLLRSVEVMDLAMCEQYSKKTKLTTKQFCDKIANGNNWWMGYQESLEVGTVDGVVNSVKEVVVTLAKQLKELEKEAPTK